MAAVGLSGLGRHYAFLEVGEPGVAAPRRELANSRAPWRLRGRQALAAVPSLALAPLFAGTVSLSPLTFRHIGAKCLQQNLNV